MTKISRSKAVSYGFALLGMILAYLLWLAVSPLINNRLSTAFYLVAIIVTGRFGGLRASLFTLIVGGCAVAYFQYRRLGGSDPAVPIIVTINFVLGVMLVLLTHSERTARETAETRADLLRQEIAERAVVERKLRDQHERLEMALAAGRLGVSTWDEQSGKIESTPTNEAIHGFAAGTLTGAFEQAFQTIHPDDLQPLLGQIGEAMKSGAASRLNYRVIWPDGSTHWIEGVGQFFCDAAGNVTRVLGVCADITARKLTEIALSEAEQRFRLLALQAPVGIYLSDGAGRCTFANHHWCEIVGCQIATDRDVRWQDFVHPDDIQRLRASWAASIENNQPFRLEYRCLRNDGEIRWIDGSAVALQNDHGELIGHVGTIMDITARKNAADALKAEQELLRQSIDFQERERQIIAYDIHDGIIQYATGALMFLEGYQGRHETTLDASEIEPALIAMRQAIADGRRVMNGIRPPLLDDAGIVAAIDYLRSEHRMAVADIEFLADPGVERLVPELESALYRIAQEALSNAIKHSGSQKIQIRLLQNEDTIRIVVKDWGVGFDLRNVARGVHGLSGIQERARLLGGKCRIQSSLNEGTCISVELPLIVRQERVAERSA
jgi:PAS domain S-box-containing protein